MSTLEQPTLVVPLSDGPPPTGRAALADATWRRTALAGLGLVAALATAEAGAPVALILGLAAASTILAGLLLVPPALRALARTPALLLAGALVAAAGLWLAVSVLGGVSSGASPVGYGTGVDLLALVAGRLPLALVVLAGVGGVVLIADALRVRLGLAARRRSPWQRVTGGGADGRPGFPWGAVAGVALVGWAGFVALGLGSQYVTGSGVEGLAFVLGVALVAAVAVGAPLLVGGLARVERKQGDGALEDERLRVAAHLHDSVLQTLALVQRQAHDPAAVARLARRQEHDLRAWMAGDTALGSDTLAGALRDVVAEVEDERGLSVEVSVLGDRPLERSGEALAAAVREALRNAARHAPVSPVFVFCEISPDRVEAFVRDEGPGFVLGAVPRERRGVRDAIVGRMAAVGGQASVESVVGEGTEVVLRIGAPR